MQKVKFDIKLFIFFYFDLKLKNDKKTYSFKTCKILLGR